MQLSNMDLDSHTTRPGSSFDGRVEYVRALRERHVPQGAADETDEAMEDENDDHGNTEIPSLSHAESVTGIVDFLKMDHIGCLQRGELWDANAIQNTILDFLYKMLEKLTDQLPLQGVSARLQPYLGMSMNVQRTRIDGKRRTDINGSSNSMDDAEICFSLDEGCMAQLAFKTGVRTFGAIEDCKEE